MRIHDGVTTNNITEMAIYIATSKYIAVIFNEINVFAELLQPLHYLVSFNLYGIIEYLMMMIRVSNSLNSFISFHSSPKAFARVRLPSNAAYA